MSATTSRQVFGDYVVPAVTLLGVLAVWEAATHALHVPRFVMPPPSAILAAGWEWRYHFLAHIWVTLYETLGGFALSILVGVPLAVMVTSAISACGHVSVIALPVKPSVMCASLA